LLLRNIEPKKLLDATMARMPALAKPSSLDIDKATQHYNYDDAQTAFLKYLLNFAIVPEQQEALSGELFDLFYGNTVGEPIAYMNEKQLDDLMGRNEIGSHGHFHKPMGLQSSAELAADLELSNNWFLQNNYAPTAISYPYGSFEAVPLRDFSMVEKRFKIGFTMERAANAMPFQNALLLARFDCNDLPGGKSPIVTSAELKEMRIKISTWFV
jgi:hypothetical protein